MKPKFLFLLLAMTAIGAVPAQAQFWKKIFSKEEKRPVRKYTPRPKPAAGKSQAAATPAKKGSELLKLVATQKKDRYRIDVLASVYLNELVAKGKPVYKSHLPDKVLPGLSFYQGVKLASDTLNAYGYHIDVYFHDITEPGGSVDALIKAAKLDSSDLIIGAVAAAQVAPLAALAKKLHINFVSMPTPADGSVKGNLYFNLLQPTLQRHCEVLRETIAKKDRRTNILVYRRTTVPVDEQCFKLVTRDSAFAYSRVMMNTVMPPDRLRNFLDSNADNVIVMPILDVAYATQLLEQLRKSFPKFRFEVYGMPSWKGMSALRKEDGESNMSVTVGAPFYFDPSASAGRGFSETFSNVFGGKPGELAYRGYETLYWYAYLLNRYGTIFNDHFADNGVAPFTRFDLELSKDRDNQPAYYENQHVYLYRYQGGSFSVEQ